MKASLAAAGLLGRIRMPRRPVSIRSPGISGSQSGRMSPTFGELIGLERQPRQWRVESWDSRRVKGPWRRGPKRVRPSRTVKPSRSLHAIATDCCRRHGQIPVGARSALGDLARIHRSTRLLPWRRLFTPYTPAELLQQAAGLDPAGPQALLAPVQYG